VKLAHDIPARERVIVALDVPDLTGLKALLEKLDGRPAFYKVGLELFVGEGERAIELVRARGGRVFLDLKLHDIPETVARAVASAARNEAELLTVHTSGGYEMLSRAADAAKGKVKILGVTVLTSVDQAALHDTGIDSSMEKQVLRLAQLGVDSGIGGVVASPLEIAPLRHVHASKLQIVTPGIRPRNAATNDQKRTLTPAEALRAGADFLVIGRPITAAPDPCAALEQIVADAI